MNEDISKQVLEKIEEKKINPKARWKFNLKNYGIIALAIVCLILSGLSFAVIVFMMRNNDWDLHGYVSHSLFEFILLTLPYFWLIFLAALVFIVYYNIRHTKRGYKYNLYSLVVFALIGSVVLGLLFYNLGLGERMQRMAVKLPFYNKMYIKQTEIWHRPGMGILVGNVVSIPSEEKILLRGFKGDQWDVFMKDCNTPIFMVRIGDKVKILGENIGYLQFNARDIRPVPCICTPESCECNHDAIKKIDMRIKGRMDIQN